MINWQDRLQHAGADRGRALYQPARRAGDAGALPHLPRGPQVRGHRAGNCRPREKHEYTSAELEKIVNAQIHDRRGKSLYWDDVDVGAVLLTAVRGR